MITAHEKLRASRLLPTAPFELLLDPETEHVIVTWPDLPAELSLIYGQDWHDNGMRLFVLDDIHHAAWVEERLGEARLVEIKSAVVAVIDDHQERRERVAEIYRVLEEAARAN